MLQFYYTLNTQVIRETYPTEKLILFSHSMGSFIGRIYASKYPSALDGLVICGTSGKNPLASIGLGIASLLKKIMGGTHKSKFIDKLSFGSFNARIKNPRTSFDWLSTTPSCVDAYISDPLCGFLFSLDGSITLMNLVKVSNSPSTFSSTKKDLPILIISGEEDPVSNYGKGASEVLDNFQSVGASNIRLKLYKTGRHEILLDSMKHEVMADVLSFLTLEIQ